MATRVYKGKNMGFSTTDDQALLEQASLTWRSSLDGFWALLPISMFVMVFGAAFGLAAVQSGLSDGTVLAMSVFIFAGAAQFAVLDMWGEQIPLIPVLVTVFAINARHLLMGATLYPWLQYLTPRKRYGSMILVSDANWAMAMQAFGRKTHGLGIVLGGGVALWLMWWVGTLIGVLFGGAISSPSQYGLDMVMGCFLLSMLLNGQKNSRVLGLWIVAGIASLLAYWYLPQNSHVVVGAIAGGIAGVIWPEGESND
jgi:predicted branched-subunit amino acid permease